MLGFSSIAEQPISTTRVVANISYELVPAGGGLGGGSAVLYASLFRGLLLDEMGRMCVAGVSESGRRVYPGINEQGRRVVNLSGALLATGGGLGGGLVIPLRAVLFAPDGGGLGGGVAEFVRAGSLLATGGGLGGGIVVPLRTVLFAPDGGGLGGGSVTPLRAVLFAPDGGGLGGGIVVPLRAMLLTPTGGGLGGGLAGFVRAGSLLAVGGGLGGGLAEFNLFNTFLFLRVSDDVLTASIVPELQAPIIAVTLNFPSLFCILNAPGIDFVLKPVPKRFDIL